MQEPTSPRSRLLAALLLSMLLTLGCGEHATSGPGAVEIGTGTVVFEALSDGQDLGIVAGTQGGYHFIVNARIRDLLPGRSNQPGALGNPQTKFSIYLEDGRQADIMARPYRLGYKESGDGWRELPSGRILQLSDSLIDSENLIPDLYGQLVRIKVRVRDAKGDEASSETWVRAIDAATL